MAAKAAVRDYYDDVNFSDYRGAWSHFSPELQASQGGFQEWRAGYANTVSTTLTSVQTVSAGPTEVVESIELVGEAIDVCGNDVTQRFAGTWTLNDSGSGFVGTDLDVAQTGGGDLVSDPSACASAEPAPQPDYVPDDSYEYDRPAPDLDCGDPGVGTNIPVGPDDPNGFDADGDGIGCES